MHPRRVGLRAAAAALSRSEREWARGVVVGGLNLRRPPPQRQQPGLLHDWAYAYFTPAAGCSRV